MRIRVGQSLVWLVLSVLALPPSQAAFAQSQEPIVIVSVSSIDNILADITYVAESVNAPELGDMIQGMTGPFVSGLNRETPFAAYASLSESLEPIVVLIARVDDMEKVQEVLQEQLGQPEKLKGGVLEFSGRLPQSVFVKHAGDWAFATNVQQELNELPDDPESLFADLAEEHTLAINLNLQAMPAEIRNAWIDGLNSGVGESLDNVEPELREATTKLVQSWVDSMILWSEQGQDLTIGWSADSEEGNISLQIDFSAAEGSDLAAKLDAGSEHESAFSGFRSPGNAVSLHVNHTLSDERLGEALLLLGVMREQAIKSLNEEDNVSAADKKQAEAFINRSLNLVEETLKSQHMNFGAAIDLDEGNLSLVSGGLVSSGKDVELLLRDLSDFAKQKHSDFTGLKFNAETRSGVRFHTADVPLDDAEPDARKALGDPLHVEIGTGEQSLFLAFGPDSNAALKNVIKQSDAKQTDEEASVELVVSLKRFLSFAQAMGPQDDIAAALDALPERGGDSLSITATPFESGMSLLLQIDGGVLSAIVAAGRASQGN